MRIEVKDNIKDIKKTLSSLEKKFVPEATVKALNKVGATALSRSKREIRKGLGMTLDQFNKGNYLTSRRARKGFEVYEINFARKTVSLYKLGASASKRGVTVKAWGRKQTYEKAFIATMPNSKRDVFVRIGGRRGAKRKVVTGANVGKTYRPELPIKLLHGPYIPTLKRQQKVDEIISKVVQERFGLEFDRALTSLFARRGLSR